MGANLVGAAGERAGFEERGAIRVAAKNSEIGLGREAVGVDVAGAGGGWLGGAGGFARKLLLGRVAVNSREVGFLTSPHSNSGWTSLAKCRVRVKTMRPLVLASSRCGAAEALRGTGLVQGGDHTILKKSGFEVINSIASLLPVKPALRGKNGQFLNIQETPAIHRSTS